MYNIWILIIGSLMSFFCEPLALSMEDLSIKSLILFSTGLILIVLSTRQQIK